MLLQALFLIKVHTFKQKKILIDFKYLYLWKTGILTKLFLALHSFIILIWISMEANILKTSEVIEGYLRSPFVFKNQIFLR